MKGRRCVYIMYFVLVFLVPLVTASCGGQTILVEAESFDDIGGWVLDQQFMAQMGLPFLLAHGLGASVADARTIVIFP